MKYFPQNIYPRLNKKSKFQFFVGIISFLNFISMLKQQYLKITIAIFITKSFIDALSGLLNIVIYDF